MSGKAKALAILNNKSYWDYVPMLDALHAQFDIDLCILETDINNHLPKTKHKVLLFRENREIPGHLPGLEYQIEDTSAIFIFDHWTMASFQGARLASKYDIPLFCLFSGVQYKLYADMANISAVKFDICRTTAKFFALSHHCKDVLIDEGVEASRIEVIPFKLSDAIFTSQRGKEFKKYIGIPPESEVVLYEDVLDDEGDAAKLLQAWRKFLSVNEFMNDPFLVIAGTGDFAADLKYLASDLGVGSKVAFLEQSTYEFKYDLYAASDYYIPCLNFKRRTEIKYPARLLEAIALGAFPVLSSNALYKEMVQGFDLKLNSNEPEDILNGLKAVSRFKKLKLGLDAEEEVVRRHFLDWSCTEQAELMLSIVEEYKKTKPNFKKAIENTKVLVTNGQYDDALIEIEDNLLKRYLTKSYKSEFFRLKGDCMKQKGSFDLALKNYEESLSHNPSNIDSYMALGRLSVSSKSYEDAANFFSKVISLDDKYGDAYAGLSLSSLNAGMISESQYYLEQAVLKDGSKSSIIPVINKLVAANSNSKNNIKFLEKLRDIAGEDKMLITALGKLHLEYGDEVLGQEYLKDIG